jgi:hypothetical protein
MIMLWKYMWGERENLYRSDWRALMAIEFPLIEWVIFNMNLVVLYAGVEVLQASVEGHCLHRPGNWLMSQLNDEPKPVY